MNTNTRYVAQQYIASSPEAEVIGSLVSSLIDNLKADEIRPIIDGHNPQHVELDVNGWYPQQVILDIQKAIAEKQVNASENLVAIGVKSVDHLQFAPEVQTIEQAIAAFNAIAKQTHRNIPDSETILVVESRPGRVVVVNNTPYPSDNIYGVLWACARRFTPAGAAFTVRGIENPDPGRLPGTAYEITWG